MNECYVFWLTDFWYWFDGLWLLDWLRLFRLGLPVKVTVLNDTLKQSFYIAISTSCHFLAYSIEQVLAADYFPEMIPDPHD